MREAPLTDRQRIVKGLVVQTNVATARTKLLLRRFPMRYSRMLLKLSTIVLLFGLLVTAPLSVALAVPKGPKGESCKKSGTTTVTGKEEGTGNKMTCTADYCTYDSYEVVGDTIKHIERTSYTNVRDCKPAALIKRPETPTLGTGGLKQVEPPPTVPPRRVGPQVAPGVQPPVAK